ncbi:MAG: ABC transporter ATP-binding protein [Pseudomonadota bacterium]|nr:ABC transporter ATP-binding protein [Pseudomonadota bacterium]
MVEPILTAENVSVRFGDFEALSGMSISVLPHTIHALIGPNGAGKTTFFNALSGVRPPDSGRIAFNGRVLTRASAHSRVRYGMARSFQVTNIYQNLDVAENVRLAVQAARGAEGWVFWRSPSTRHDNAREVEEILSLAGVADRAATRAGDLSHAAQRSLEIGMALAGRPKLICLDEPLAGMGIDDVHRAKELIVGLKARMAVLLIEHNMGVVLSISDRVTVMARGRKIAEDAPDAIRSNSAVRAAYLGSQA